MVKQLTIVLLAIVPTAYAAPVSFNDAWHTVVTTNDGLAADRASVEQAQYMQDAAKDLYLPKVTVGANYTHLDHDIKLSPSDVFSSMPASNTEIGKIINNIVSNSQLNSAFTSTISDRDVFTSSIRAIWPIF